MLTAERESVTDYEQMAALGTAAFNNPNVELNGGHLKWFYENSYSLGSTVIALKENGAKVGQIAMVNQGVVINGRREEAAQLVDLFIEKSHRGMRGVAMLYGEVEKQIRAQKLRFAFSMPNANAVQVNQRFFKLKTHLALQVRIGVSLPLTWPKAKTSFQYSAERRGDIIALADRFATPSNENGLVWDGEGIFNRLGAGKFSYALHATDNLFLVSSPRETRGLRYTLLCGFLRNPNGKVSGSDIRSVTRAACATWGRPVFVYAGHYAAITQMPGFPLPKRIHHSLMLLQVRDFFPERGSFEMDRFQLIDFDFA